MMIKYILSLCLCGCCNLMTAQITGQWNGSLAISAGLNLRLVFHISQTDTGYSATMDSPDQGAKGIPVSSVDFNNNVLKLAIPAANIAYEGVLSTDSIIGKFKQGQELPLNLHRQTDEQAHQTTNQEVNRPQNPIKPYPYYSEDITFRNTNAGIDLAGTLTLPQKDGVFPAVILISGSGPQNRDEELLGHKPFLVLSDYLTRNGIAVLRFDDRGVFGSGGDFKTATSSDFATDVTAALQYLKTRKEINQKQIGLLGHSEGGIIAPMVASQSKDVAFIVLLAGTGLPGNEILLIQQQLIGRASGMSSDDLQKSHNINKGAFDIIVNALDTVQLKKDLNTYLSEKGKDDANIAKSQSLMVSQLSNPWMVYFIKHDPAKVLEKVKCPVLALNGELDLQVSSKENLMAIQKALNQGGNKKVSIKELPKHNHLFQECSTGAPSEYANIEQTLSPTSLNEILSWIKTIVK